MDEVKFCDDCSKLISTEYNYCPWCGKKRERSMDLPSLLEQAMGSLEKIQMEDRLDNLAKLEDSLDSLEGEINAFLSKTR